MIRRASDDSERLARLLVAHHRKFLRFLEPRVGNRATAEELLQAAYAKSVEKLGTLRKEESAVAWFYRLLRNAAADHHRRRASEARAFERNERDEDTEEAPELREAVCHCVSELASTLKEEYATVLQRVDVEETGVPGFAAEVGITPNAAGVRLHRARTALRNRVQMLCGACAAHGCLACTCQGYGDGPGSKKQARAVSP